MRSIVALLLLVSLLLLPCMGCKPDPRDQEGFDDNPDPAAAAEQLEPTEEGAGGPP